MVFKAGLEKKAGKTPAFMNINVLLFGYIIETCRSIRAPLMAFH